MKQIYIIGAGSVGGHIASNPSLYGLENTEILFMDHDPNKIGTTFFGRKIIGPEEDLLKIKEPINVFIGTAFQNIKKRVYDKLASQKHISFPSLIAKNAWISKGVTIGKGVIVYPNVRVNLGGNTIIGEFTEMGIGSSTKQFIHIGNNVQVGGQAMVVDNIKSDVRVKGVPAKEF